LYERKIFPAEIGGKEQNRQPRTTTVKGGKTVQEKGRGNK